MVFQESLKGVSSFKEVSRVFQGSFKDVFRKFQGFFEEVSRVFQGSFKSVLMKFLENFKGVSKMFQGYSLRLEGSSSFKGIQEYLKEVQRVC